MERVLKNAKLPHDEFGVLIMDAKSGNVLFEKNADGLFNPASTAKLITSAAALSILGPNFRFQTKLWQKDGKVCLEGGGDPSLVSETLWNLAEEAQRAGISKNASELIVDETMFSYTSKAKKAFQGDRGRAFMAPIHPLSLNYNSITIEGRPGEIGKSAKISVHPNLSLFKIRNSTKTRRSSNRKDLQASLRWNENHYIVDVSGYVGQNFEKVEIYRSVNEPALYAGEMLLEHLRRANVMMNAKLRKGTCDRSGSLLVNFESQPLSSMIFNMNKFSNNFIADTLLYHLGESRTTESGVAAIEAWLKKRSIPIENLTLENGSGLSRDSRLSARIMVNLLRSVYEDWRIAPEFFASLSIGGTDGTLRNMFHDLQKKASVRAKTGQLRESVTLAGIVSTDQGQHLLFTFLFSTKPGQAWKYYKIQEDLLTAAISE